MDVDEYFIPNQGIILSTAHSLTATQKSQPEDHITGDPDLESQIYDNAAEVFDACFIQFEFSCPIDAGRYSTNINFQYVFGSEEYSHNVNHENNDGKDRRGETYTNNDAFGVFLNGQNIALIPDRDDAAGGEEDGRGILPVTINTINSKVNSEFFVNNNPSHSKIKGGGYTTELRASGQVFPGWNSIKFVVGDAGDENLDSWVFLKGGSFSCKQVERDVNVEPPITYPTEIDLAGINLTESVPTVNAPTESVPTESVPTESENGDQEEGIVVVKANFIIPMSMAVGVIVLLGLLALTMPLIGLSFYDKRQTCGCGRKGRRYGKAKNEVAKKDLAQKEPGKKEPESA